MMQPPFLLKFRLILNRLSSLSSCSPTATGLKTITRPIGKSHGRKIVAIDGYNVIYQHREWAVLTAEEARRRLISFVRDKTWPFAVARCYVVFDAKESSRLVPAEELIVQFAAPSADSYIRDLARASAEPGRLAVISDDKEIIHTAKVCHAKHFTARWFLEESFKKAGPPKGKASEEPGKSGLSALESLQITEEMAEYWLRKRRDSSQADT